MSSSQSAISGLGCGTHTVRGGMDPGDRCFCPRVVGVVMYKMIPDPWMGAYPLRFRRRSAGTRRWPQGKLSQRACFYELEPISIQWVGG